VNSINVDIYLIHFFIL